MCTQAKSYANTGAVTISIPNPALDGSGTLGTVLTALSSGSGGNGTLINTIVIKAIGNTMEGMVRLFTYDGTNTFLFKEIYIPATTQTSIQPSFRAVILDELNLDPGHILKASTQNPDSFNIVAFGTDWKNCECSGSLSCADALYIANTGMSKVNIANSGLDGSGTINTVVTASTVGLAGGTQIPIVNIKATQTTSLGMIRLFIDTGGTSYLITEVPIPAVDQNAFQPAYRAEVPLGIFLKPGYSLKASTQNSENFDVIACATDWVNCAC